MPATSQPVPDSKLPVAISLALIAVGLVIGLLGGFTEGSIVGGIIAACGAIPAMVGMWKGIQQESQGTLGMSVVCVLLSLGVGALLIILRIIHWVR
jgi:hypothetical protein